MLLSSAHSLSCRLAVLLIVAGLPAAGGAAEPTEPYTTIDAAVTANKLMWTKETDGGKGTFSERPKKPGVLIGFEVGLGRFVNIEVIYALRPIYLTPDGERTGAAHGLFPVDQGGSLRSQVSRTVKVKAKPGYAVGGLTARQGLLLNGMSLRFERIDGNRLDPRDSYSSDWIGDRTGGGEVSFATKGMLAIGIHGKDSDRSCNAIGLIHLDPAAVPESKADAVKTPAPKPE
jgi:hypothetical protein